MSTEIIIRPPSHADALRLKEILPYRDMILARLRKNIKVQFHDMYLGSAWAVAQPLTVVAVFVWLRRVTGANMNVDLPYPVYIFAGLILWYYFVNATTAVSSSARRDAALLKRVYFPRLITPLLALLEHLYELLLGFVPLVLMLLWYGIRPGWRLVLLPAVVLQVMALSLGAGTLWGAWSLRGADLDRVLRQVFYLGFFLSPVVLAPASSWSHLYYLNPMAGALLAFRSCLAHDFPFPTGPFAFSVAFSLALLAVGLRTYRRAESDFLDQL